MRRRLLCVFLLLVLMFGVEAGSGAFVREVSAAGTITGTIHYSPSPQPRVWGNCYINSVGADATIARLQWFHSSGGNWVLDESIQQGPPIWAAMSWNTAFSYYAGSGHPVYALECTLWKSIGGGQWAVDAIDWDEYP